MTAVVTKGRPIDTSNLASAVTEGCDVLSHCPDIYQRDGRLVRVVTPPDDAPQIKNIERATLKVILSSIADWDSATGTKLLAAPPDPVVDGILMMGEWPGVRPLRGIIETPTIREDGSVLQTPGYDSATRLVYIPGASVFPPVPDKPSQDDARSALATLTEVFADFPETEASRMVGVAAVLTMVARAAVDDCPAFLFEASTRGAGKGLKTNVIARIATGRNAPKATFPSGNEELEKMLGSVALSGVRLISFDNVDRSFGGASLDKVLTCGGACTMRVLGQSSTPTLPWQTIVFATGNNISLTGDMSRRVLVSRLEPQIEDPENRTDYQRPERAGTDQLLAYVSAQRATLVSAALTIVRAYVVAGMPDQVRAWGGFERWSKHIASAIVWAGGANPCDTRPKETDGLVNGENELLLRLMAAWPEEPVTAKGALDSLSPPLREVAAEITQGKQNAAKALGDYLRHRRGKVLGNKRFVSHGQDRNKVARWMIETVAG